MKNNIVRIFGIQAALLLVIGYFTTKDSSHHELLFLVFGGLFSGFQFGLLYFIWWRIFTKKKIAPSVIAVVIKYALLGLVFWSIGPLQSSQSVALVLGILSSPISLILFALTKRPQ